MDGLRQAFAADRRLSGPLFRAYDTLKARPQTWLVAREVLAMFLGVDTRGECTCR